VAKKSWGGEKKKKRKWPAFHKGGPCLSWGKKRKKRGFMSPKGKEKKGKSPDHLNGESFGRPEEYGADGQKPGRRGGTGPVASAKKGIVALGKGAGQRKKGEKRDDRDPH